MVPDRLIYVTIINENFRKQHDWCKSIKDSQSLALTNAKNKYHIVHNLWDNRISHTCETQMSKHLIM